MFWQHLHTEAGQQELRQQKEEELSWAATSQDSDHRHSCLAEADRLYELERRISQNNE